MKYLLGILAVLGMLLVTSCSQSDLVTESLTSDFINATFTLGTDDGIDSRTEANAPVIGDGTKVDKVACAVYNADGMELKELYDVVDVADKTATYNVRLAKGQVYRVAFFAYNEAAEAYDVRDLKNVVVKAELSSNNENRDAFTAYYDIEANMTMTNINKTVTLTRPFAQLNLGVDSEELEAARKSGIEVVESQIVVSNVYTVFSAYDNIVPKNAETGSMTFKMASIPEESLKVDGDEDGEDESYTYLALNYLLVGEKSLTDVKFSWISKNGYTNTPVTEFTNIPVQRNYRTNVVGKLLTSPATFNIVVDAKFKDEQMALTVFTAEDLQTVLNTAPSGTSIVYLGGDIKGDVVVNNPNEDSNIIIEGCGHNYDGTITIQNGGSVTFLNVNFESEIAEAGEMFGFVAIEGNTARNTVQTVTLDGCTFSATGAGASNVVGVLANNANVEVKNTKAHGIGSLVYAENSTVSVQDCEVTGCVNGVVFEGVKEAVVEGTTIAASENGISFDGSIDDSSLKVEGNDITANQPLVVCNLTGNDIEVILEGQNTLNTDSKYQIVLTNGESDEKAMPTGSYKLTGADGYDCYPSPFQVAS